MSIKKLIISFVFFPLVLLEALSEQPHHTTAYIGRPNSLNTLISYSNYSTDHFWNSQGKKLPTFNNFQRHSYLLYSEYALNTRNSLSLNGGYSTVTESLNGSSQGIEDIELGWKFLISQNKSSAFTTQVIAIIPSGDRKSSFRYGQFGGQVGLLYSKFFCLYKQSGWVDLNIAYRFYKGFPSDQMRASLSLGYDLNSKITIIGSGQLDYGLSKNRQKFDVNNITLNPSYKLFKARLECLINLYSHVSLTIGGFQHVWGRDTGTGGGFFVGTWIIL